MKLYKDYLEEEIRNKKKAEDEKKLREYGEDFDGSPVIIYEPDTIVQTGRKVVKGVVTLLIFIAICAAIGALLIYAGTKM